MTKLAVGGTLAVLISALTLAQESVKAPPLHTSVPSFIVTLVDDSSVRVTMLDEMLEYSTAHGALHIPFRDVRKLDLALRVTANAALRIDPMINDLSSGKYQLREAATNGLRDYGELAWPALQKAAKSSDPETVQRAGSLIEKLKQSVPAERLSGRTHDLLYTQDSKIAGKLIAASLRVRTLAFGEQLLSVADIRSVRSAHLPQMTDAAALPDPGTLATFAGQPAKSYSFRVTGKTVGGTVWGTDIYTVDSTLAMVAVHAGLLKPEQTGVIKVELVGVQASFAGSSRNGVTSAAFGQFNGFRVLPSDDAP